jgi:hypothetical protein
MKNIPTRDITGKCEGECRDLVREGEEKRQSEIKASGLDYPEPSSSVPDAFSRNEAPGFLGGHV